jgi:hypothetical protein
VLVGSVDACGLGPGEPSRTCTFSYPPGSQQPVEVQAAPGSAFVGWLGACTGSGPCTVTMNGPRQLTATFVALPPVTLALTASSVSGGAGTVTAGAGRECTAGPDAPATCSFPVEAGSILTIEAMPAAGSTFRGWWGACTGTGPCVVTMDGARAVTARFGPDNRPPVAHAGGPYTGVRNMPVTFDGSGSSDPDGDPLIIYLWEFGDGTSGYGVTPSHVYTTRGTFQVFLWVFDGQETSGTVTTVTIGNAPPLAQAGPDQAVRSLFPVTLDGRASSDPDGSIAAYSWRRVAGPAVSLTGASTAQARFTSPLVPPSATVVLEFELRVTDNDGTSRVDRVLVTVTR